MLYFLAWLSGVVIGIAWSFLIMSALIIGREPTLGKMSKNWHITGEEVMEDLNHRGPRSAPLNRS